MIKWTKHSEKPVPTRREVLVRREFFLCIHNGEEIRKWFYSHGQFKRCSEDYRERRNHTSEDHYFFTSELWQTWEHVTTDFEYVCLDMIYEPCVLQHEED